MENQALERIKEFAISILNGEYGFYGCADSDNFCMLNASNNGRDFKITFKDEEE